jgi:hypothetical protein
MVCKRISPSETCKWHHSAQVYFPKSHSNLVSFVNTVFYRPVQLSLNLVYNPIEKLDLYIFSRPCSFNTSVFGGPSAGHAYGHALLSLSIKCFYQLELV